MSENKNSLEIEESLIYTRKGHAMITSNPIIECSIFKNDEFNEAYILKSKFDLLEELRAKTNAGYMEKVDEIARLKREAWKRIEELEKENQKLEAEIKKVKFKPSDIVITTLTTYTKTK